jgi:hypothetical protein
VPVTILALALVIATALSGCSSPEAPFVDNKATYDESSVMTLASGVDASKLANTASEDAAPLRHKALTTLRSRGGSAVPVADMLTKTFSAETRAVPIYFERATFKGKPAVVVVEAAGPAKGKLTTKRVWVLDEQGGVVFMGAR